MKVKFPISVFDSIKSYVIELVNETIDKYISSTIAYKSISDSVPTIQHLAFVEHL